MLIQWNYGGTCIDSFGLKTPAILWVEWIVAVPLLFYIAFAIDDKERLAKEETAVILGFFLLFFMAFCVQIKKPYWVDIFLEFASYLLYGVLNYVLIKLYRERHRRRAPVIDTGIGYERLFTTSPVRQNLSIVLCVLNQSFLISHILALSRAINNDVLFTLFAISNTSVKVIFATIAMNAYLDVHHKRVNILTAEHRSSISKRLFFKNVTAATLVPLRTLLMGIKRISQSGCLRQADLQSLSRMSAASGFLEMSINDMMASYSQEDPSLPLTMQPILLREFIDSVVASFECAFFNKHIHVAVNLDTGLPVWVCGDCPKLSFVFANLISNAIKASADNSTITIDVSPVVLHGKAPEVVDGKLRRCIKLSVTDQGEGMPVAVMQQIFQSDDESESVAGALALTGGGGRVGYVRPNDGAVGLFVCKAITKAHGGSLTCLSSQNRGCTVSLIIFLEVLDGSRAEVGGRRRNSIGNCNPGAKATDPAWAGESKLGVSRPGVIGTNPTSASALHAPPPMMNEAMQSTDSFYRILIVDTSLSHSKMLGILLKRKHCNCEMVKDAPQAVLKIEADVSNYDVVIVDNVTSTNVSATRFVRIIRSMGYENLVMGMMSVADDMEYSGLLRAGADIVMMKPLSMPLINLFVQHLHEEGSQSRTGMKLQVQGSRLEWFSNRT